MLELHAICKHWQPYAPRHAAPRPLLQDLALEVRPGETAALLGPSGSGKSTLLKIVAGLEPPESGRVLFAGQDITHTPPERRGFALMFQDFALFPHLNVQDNVASRAEAWRQDGPRWVKTDIKAPFPGTLSVRALHDHGPVAPALAQGAGQAEAVLLQLVRHGIELDTIGNALLLQGLTQFEQAHAELLALLE
eukprot:gene31040-biopygen23478